MWIIKVVLICILLIIFFEDVKDRMVHWFLYPLVGFLAFALQITKIGFTLAIVHVMFNLAFVLALILVCWGYASFRLKKPFLKEAFGLGDVLFFNFIAFSFSIISFLTIFVFSLVFSLLLHLLLKKRLLSHTTVPLAGYMSFFFAVVYVASALNDLDLLLYTY